jgi:hypothetical protein
MSTTTTNFGWTVPSDTDLVKDGAAAIRTALGGVDTSFVDLKGGTSGQVLSKASGTDLDFTWVAQDDSNAIQNAIVDAKGDLIAATAADTPARLAVGTNGQVLTADSTAATGLAWATAGGGNFIKIASGTFTNQASVAVDSCFTSTYRNYILISNVYSATTDTDDFQLQFRYGGSTQTSTYYGAYTMINRSNTTTNAGYTSAGQMLLATSLELAAKAASRVNLTITNVGISGNPVAYGTGMLGDGPNVIDLACSQDTARTYDGFLLKSSSSNITGNYAVYGVSD